MAPLTRVVGFAICAGRIVTVIDLAAHLNIGRITMGEETRLLIFEHQQEHYGFLVDSVIEAIPLEQDQIEPVPSSLDPALRARLLGVWRQQDELTALHDPDVLFTWRDARMKIPGCR